MPEVGVIQLHHSLFNIHYSLFPPHAFIGIHLGKPAAHAWQLRIPSFIFR